MKKFKRKGFTLIELIAVLVIMAIIALIVMPLVMSIIRRARVSADKRSIDAYGRSVELAIAGYLLDNGKFPTDISQLTIEYSGEEVVCTTTQINPDSSVYLSGCKVNNREVSNYTYGADKSPSYQTYSAGDTVTYNNIDFYVIKDSGAKEDTVTLLKAEPLTTEEVNLYGGVGTANNHVNMHVTSDTTASYYQTADDRNGYGSMQYYSSSTCGYNGTDWIESGCTTDYSTSEIKYVVDAWKNAKVSAATEARLIILDDLLGNLGFEITQNGSGQDIIEKTENTPDFVCDYTYWTNSSISDNGYSVYLVVSTLTTYSVYDIFGAPRLVRPVIVLPKSALN